MSEDVAEADDLGVVVQEGGNILVSGGDDVGCLTDDDELTFNCGSDYPVALEFPSDLSMVTSMMRSAACLMSAR